MKNTKSMTSRCSILCVMNVSVCLICVFACRFVVLGTIVMILTFEVREVTWFVSETKIIAALFELLDKRTGLGNYVKWSTAVKMERWLKQCLMPWMACQF